MFLRRMLCRRLFNWCTLACGLFFTTLLLFGDLKSPLLAELTELDRCPTCYGVSICPELYSNVVSVQPAPRWLSLFNAKNVFDGVTKTGKKVILKKLAHTWELKEFDAFLCKTWKKPENCAPRDLLNVTNIEEKIVELVKYDFEYQVTEVKKGLVMCPYPDGIRDIIQPVLIKEATKDKNAAMLNVWTMLHINPEPIILQLLPRSRGWPVPTWGGACGRIALISHSGERLSSLSVPWIRRLYFAKQILKAAMDFTFKHDRYRFYLMDWSLDNIVADEAGKVTFIDLEDVIILDKHTTPGPELPDWYSRYHRETIPGFVFSIQKMCRHHLSDHNMWAACYLLAGAGPGEQHSLLKPVPDSINTSKPYLDRLLNECLVSNNKFDVVSKLQHVIDSILEES